MSGKARGLSDSIEESVCQFYLNRKTECDEYYYNAERTDIGTLYENISDQKKIQLLLSQVSIVVLTANKYEKNILHHNIAQTQQDKIIKFEIALFPYRVTSKGETFAYWFKWHDYVVLHIEAPKMGSYTIGGSADIVRYLINNEYIVPMGIVSYGICFGADETKYQLGDVAISEKVYPYFIESKIKEKSYFVNDDNMFKITSSLRAKIKNAKERNVFSTVQSGVYFGNFITGEAVVSRKSARDTFCRSISQEVIAGEMEGYGVFKECGAFCNPIPCLIVKSICDWAVQKNFKSQEIFKKLYPVDSVVTEIEQNTLKDRIQAYAAKQAFDTLNILFEEHIFEQSLYVKVDHIIGTWGEKVILKNSIKNEILKTLESAIKGVVVTDNFIDTLINKLVDDQILIYEDFESRQNGVRNIRCFTIRK